MQIIPELKARPDIEHILNQSRPDFDIWFSLRRDATKRLLRDYELFASIPHLGYQTQPYTIGTATTAVKNNLKALSDGLTYLDAIYKLKTGKEFKEE